MPPSPPSPLTPLELLRKAILKSEKGNLSLASTIQCALGGWHKILSRESPFGKKGYYAPEDCTGREADGKLNIPNLARGKIWKEVRDVTSSLDEAIVLLEKNLPPPVLWTINSQEEILLPHAHIYHTTKYHSEYLVWEVGNSPALALCAAVVSILIEKEKE